MEDVIARMQDEKNGIPIRTVKSFLSKIPSVFSGKRIQSEFHTVLNFSLCLMWGDGLVGNILNKYSWEFTVIQSGGDILYPLNSLIIEVFDVSLRLEWVYIGTFYFLKIRWREYLIYYKKLIISKLQYFYVRSDLFFSQLP